MKTVQHPNGIDASFATRFVRTWFRWAVFFFLVAALFGLLLRYFMVGPLPDFLEYTYFLHAHSHMAMLGWGYLLLSGMMVITYVKDTIRLQRYRALLIWTVVANLGMMVSFPVQGYGVYSIAFSTLHVMVSYGFAYRFLSDLQIRKRTPDVRLVRFAVIWMVVSSVGLWAVAPIGIVFGKLHPLYFLSVQWFLHFQLNGWFVYGLLGLLVAHSLKGHSKPLRFSSDKELVLHVSLLLTFALTVSWRVDWPPLVYINGVGVLLQALGYAWILVPVIGSAFPNLCLPGDWWQRMIYLGVLSLIGKGLIQLTLVIPGIAGASYGIRSYVIGFIHLVLLGAVTFGLGGTGLKEGWLPTSRATKIGWTLIAIGFVTSEILLLGQGTLVWMSLGPIPQYNLMLLIASATMPFGLVFLVLGKGKE